MASLNDFSRLWGTGVVPGCWYLALGTLGRDLVPQTVKAQDEGSGWDVLSELVGLCMKVMLTMGSWGWWRGVEVPSGVSKAPRSQSIKNGIKNI